MLTCIFMRFILGSYKPYKTKRDSFMYRPHSSLVNNMNNEQNMNNVLNFVVENNNEEERQSEQIRPIDINL